jgi:phosphoribosylformylglycinamidine synthase subunit PurSL
VVQNITNTLGYVGLNVPKVTPSKFALLYRALFRAIDKELVASTHGVYRGGLGVHLPMVAMGGHLGMKIDLSLIPSAMVWIGSTPYYFQKLPAGLSLP